jgi:tRNA A-37 threonylcarbamoyl transferase component Bud32
MAFLEINPGYRALLQQQGLVRVPDFLNLPGVIVSGHPDRHVARVELGTVSAFLKREHRVRWKDRLLNKVAGFGLVSKSSREAQTLQRAARAGIGCPEWLAVGEDDDGRAFLLIRDLANAVELRRFLESRRQLPLRVRQRFAQRLGIALARLHDAGFDHPDLYSKHILIEPQERTIWFLDWQRTGRQRAVSWPERWRDLAALDATLSEHLAPIRERTLCLRAYLRTCRTHNVAGDASLLRSVYGIAYRTCRLLRQRRIREIRRLPALTSPQKLVWIDGEKLCLTPECQDALAGTVPQWLLLKNLPGRPRRLVERTWVALGENRPALLVRRRSWHFWDGWLSWLRGRRPTAPELRQAGLLFRLERSGIRTPRLLAFGQHWHRSGCCESLLLTEPDLDCRDLGSWFATHPEDAPRRHQVLRELADLWRRLHEANCCLSSLISRELLPARSLRAGRSSRLNGLALKALDVAVVERPSLEVVLRSLDGIGTRHQLRRRTVHRDLTACLTWLAHAGVSRSDRLRFLKHYLHIQRLTPEARRLLGARAATTAGRARRGNPTLSLERSVRP